MAKKAVGDLYIDDIRFEDLYGPKPVDTADMSSHQKRQMELMEEIEELEAQAIGDKHWTLAGEASKAARPADSALDAIMEFQQATKAAPVVTVETTIALEDMIKRRVLDEAYDDPVAPADAGPMGEKEELPELSTEKSDKGLGEIYEQEYMKSAMGVTEDDPKQPIRDEIASLMKQLFYKLDALSNFHFTPKPVVQTANVSTDVAAIDMEEIVPLAVRSPLIPIHLPCTTICLYGPRTRRGAVIVPVLCNLLAAKTVDYVLIQCVMMCSCPTGLTSSDTSTARGAQGPKGPRGRHAWRYRKDSRRQAARTLTKEVRQAEATASARCGRENSCTNRRRGGTETAPEKDGQGHGRPQRQATGKIHRRYRLWQLHSVFLALAGTQSHV